MTFPRASRGETRNRFITKIIERLIDFRNNRYFQSCKKVILSKMKALAIPEVTLCTLCTAQKVFSKPFKIKGPRSQPVLTMFNA